MTLQDNSIDFTTLTWVKPELDETLKQARNALQGYVEEGENPAELRTCADLLHQVQGTLRMVELYGAAMVAEEMEQLGRALIDKRVADRDAAYAVLMQGIVQLPDYLERLQGGHRDIPIVLLPLLNQLRASRGEKGLSESVLFSPDLSRPLPTSAQGPVAPLPHLELTRRAEALRGLFQGALLRWLKDDNSPATIRDLTDVCEQLVPITTAEPARRLFWVAAGTLDALARNAFPISTPLKQALAKVEREIKRLADGGDAAFRIDPPIELTKQLLYFVAHEGSDNGRIGEIRQVFGLSGSEPSEAELAHARGSLSGNNRALLETVAVAIKDDLLRVKDALDLHLRTPGATPAALSAQVDALDRVADTLGMLGLAVPRRVVQDQRTAVNDVVSGVRRDDEATLLDIAGALLYVEAALDDQVERLGKEGGETANPADGNESRRLLEALVKEAIVNFSQARQSFVGFVETHWDHRQLAEVPRLLNEVAGALRILNVPLPADYLVGIRQFTENELLQRKQVPNGQQMDRLADALASLEYFLEALRDRRPNREQILEVARQSLTALGYWPLSAAMRAAPVRVEAPAPVVAAPVAPVAPVAPDAPVAPVAPVAPSPAIAPAEPALPVASVEAPAAEPAPEPSAPAAPASTPAPVAAQVGELVPGFDAGSSEEIDDEIREVFLEEFEEEIENLQQLLPPWREDPANAELLRPIRRVFHTLKGSGRLVGARALGEFSWKIESMLNRVLDGSRPASAEVMAMVQLALDHLPLLRAALQGQPVHADLEGIQAVAERIAAGEEVAYRSPVVAATPAPEADEVAAEAEADLEAATAEAEAPAEEALVADPEDADAPVFSIDPVLLEILKPEVAGHLETVDAWLAACAARGPQPVTDPLLRSIHTMNGAFAMTEVLSITEVTAPLEGFVKRSLAHELVPGDAGIALVADAARAIRATVQAIEKPRPVLPHFSELAARAVSLRDTLPDSVLPSMPMHVDEEPMPQVVDMEAADTSAIPDFASDDVVTEPQVVDAELADAPLAADADFSLEPIDETIVEAETVYEPVAELQPEAEAEAELQPEAEAEAAIDFAMEEFATPEPAADFGSEFEEEAQVEALVETQQLEAPQDEESQVEEPQVEEPQVEEPQVEEPQVEAPQVEAPLLEATTMDQSWADESWADAEPAPAMGTETVITAEYPLPDFDAAAQLEVAQASMDAREPVEQEAAIEVAPDEAQRASVADDDMALADFDAAFEPSDASAAEAAELEAAFATESFEAPESFQGSDAVAVFEAPVDSEAEIETAAEIAAEVEALAEPESVEAAVAPADFEPVAEIEPIAEAELSPLGAEWDADIEMPEALEDADDIAVAHVAFPEDQLLSVEEFLREASQLAVQEESAPEPEPEAAASLAETPSFDGTPEAFEEDAEAVVETASWDAAVADSDEERVAADAGFVVDDEQVGTAFDDAAEAEPEPIAAAEPADDTASDAGEPAIADEVPVEADASVEYEAYSFTEASPATADAEASEDALAGMIAAFDLPAAQDAVEREDSLATLESGEQPGVPTFSDEDFLSADALASLPAGEFLAADEPVEASEPFVSFDTVGSADDEGQSELEVIDAEAPPAPVSIDEGYYGMSLAELEALTAPVAAEATAEAAESVAETSVAAADVAATADAPAFIEASLVGDVPAWTGLSAPEPTANQDVESGAPAADEAIVDEAAAEEFVAHEFVAEEFIAEEFVAEESVAEEVVAEEVSAEETVAEETVAEETVAEETVAEEVVTEEPITEEPVAEEVVAEEPVTEEPVAEEPVAEGPVAEEPVAEEPVAEEPVAEELIMDEPEEAAEAEPEVAVARDIAPPAWIRPQVPMARDAADPELDLDMTDLDPELLDLFLEESNDILDHSDGVLARLRDEPGDRDSITTLQRDLHTLKGGARMAGIDAVGELGHAMESLLESVAEGRQKLDPTGVVVLERGFDRLHGMVARIGERKAIALPARLIAQVEALSQGRALGETETQSEAPAATDGQKASAPVQAEPARPLSAPIDDLLEEELTGVRAPQEQVRIRADLLDRLVNYAGEVAIYRARLEQQLGAFRANLGELDQTTTRLREQLRRLDIETEAQIVARYQREGEEQDANFDPLELDRFTNQQQLTRALNESANDLVNLQGVLDDLTRQYETLLLQQSRVSSDLQEGLMRTRMVPFDALVPRLRRVLRQAATDTGKQVQLKVDGASGEMDRNVLDRMTAPLEHMLRNAMAHGLELPEERRKLRKPEEGTVRIQVQREGSEVVLKVSDDGRGLDKAAIRAKAIERGLVKADAELSDDALYGLILETGFSTAESVSRLAGRGVGMDVVYSEIRQLGGTLQIKSEFGKGSEFVIRLPFTLAVTQAVFVKIGDTSFAVPIASVQGVGRISRVDLDKQLAGDNPVFQYAGEDYAIHDLGQLIGHAPAKAQDSLQMPLLLARSGDLRTAICIDQVLGSREIVVKPVGPQVNSVPGIFGATIMGDGRVVVILDVAPLVRRQGAIAREAREAGAVRPAAPAPVAAARRVPVVMVVDDSITMRKVTGRVLERNNMEVLTAKDGVDAVEKMAERVPDLVLLDIEMPRMDGYEVAQNMKSDPRLRDVPIIMITSRTGEKHRQRAMDIGVDRYLGKPYQEPELMRNVFEMLRMEPVSG